MSSVEECQLECRDMSNSIAFFAVFAQSKLRRKEQNQSLSYRAIEKLSSSRELSIEPLMPNLN